MDDTNNKDKVIQDQSLNKQDKSEREKMLAGEYYFAMGDELFNMRNNASDLYLEFNKLSQRDKDKREEIMNKLFGKVGKNCFITPPFRCDYGCHITLGDGVYMNFDCVILDCNYVEIGDNTLLAPNVHIYAATHPTDPSDRLKGYEFALPVKIGKNCWIGGCVVILPGVTIGDNTTIGAGSVVTKNIPANVIAAGNPCKVLRSVFDVKEKVKVIEDK